MGLDVVAARDLDGPYRRAWETHPDLIVTDVPVPNYDGWQVLRDLRQDPRRREIPLVALTGSVQRSVRERAVRDGFAR
jgi:CheY-like chemotaxis protein